MEFRFDIGRRLRSLFRSAHSGSLLNPSGLHRLRRTDSEVRVRRLSRADYVGDHTALCRILGRYKMYVDTRDLGLAPHLMLEGFWEMWVTRALIPLVRPGMVVADIGANVGYFALLMADLVGRHGVVHAFEPNPRPAALLRKSAFVNGFASLNVHECALGNGDDSELALVVPADLSGSAYVAPWAEHLSGHALKVPVCRLDSRPDWMQIELAKIDVEGAERVLWAGMQGLLDHGRLKTVLIEFAATRYDDPRSFLNELVAPGFSLAFVDYARGVVATTIDAILEEDPHVETMLVLRR